jgi:hypothetical protein
MALMFLRDWHAFLAGSAMQDEVDSLRTELMTVRRMVMEEVIKLQRMIEARHDVVAADHETLTTRITALEREVRAMRDVRSGAGVPRRKQRA